jgi:hypothetical protein
MIVTPACPRRRAVRESVHRLERALVNFGYKRHNGRTVSTID